MDEEIKQCIRKHALKNAFDFGRADSAKVMSKVLGEFSDQKKNAAEIMTHIKQEVECVNKMSEQQIKTELENYSFDKKIESQKKQTLIENEKNEKIITRFPPEPSGHLHIGHAKAIFLNYCAAKEQNGAMRLRMDDTNPQKAKQEFVEGIIENLKWLGIEWIGEITYSSDYMQEFYEYAYDLIMHSKAYVCTCPQQQIKEGREKMVRCDCAARLAEENASEFKKMIEGDYKSSEAILRYKADMKAINTVMRDPTLFRIVEHEHYRTKSKYKCWPNYDFVAPILDSIEGVTHAMRSKEYELRDELYFSILEDLNLRKPNLVSFSRLAIKGAPVSKRLITPLIEQKKVEGYDDIRLPTLMALRRRGIQPQAIKEFVLGFGLSKVESEPNWDKLLSQNRKLIDPYTQRRFFVPFGARVDINNVQTQRLEVKNHPTNQQLGVREIIASSPAYISPLDADEIQIGEIFRLKDWCNVKLVQKDEIDTTDLSGNSARMKILKCEICKDNEIQPKKKIQWVCDEIKVAVEVSIAHDLYIKEEFNENSLEHIWGWGERSINQMQQKDVCQFERFGFVKFDYRDQNLHFVFISK